VSARDGSTDRELERLNVALAECRTELEREQRFGHSVTDATTSLLLVVDSAGTIVPGGVNVAMERLSGWREDELVGRRFEAVDPTVWLASDEAPAFASPYLTRAGERRHIEWTARRLDWPEGTRYLLCGIDVTDWRRQQARLRSSRARIVAAGDNERRRLERNLHDGAQQRLVSVLLALRLIETMVSEQEPVATRLGEARAELTEALGELRELAHGLHPSVLTTHGLGIALEAVATRATIPVEVSVELAERPSASVEAAAYYIVAEAVTNAQKHARATTVRVTVSLADGFLHVDVSDNGIGGASPHGSGLVGLDDRVQALGGSLQLESPAGHGTQITAQIPLSRAHVDDE